MTGSESPREDDDQEPGSCGECDTDALAQDHTRHAHLRADSVEVRSFDGRARRSRPR